MIEWKPATQTPEHDAKIFAVVEEKEKHTLDYGFGWYYTESNNPWVVICNCCEYHLPTHNDHGKYRVVGWVYCDEKGGVIE